MGRAFEYRRAAKEKRWSTMSKVFPRLAKSITMAAKDGGDDPDMNPKLRTAIINAKSQNMPKDNIEAAIKRASGKDSAQLVEITYEGKAPHGALIFVEAMTDNTTRTVANVKSCFTKLGGQFLQNGSLEFMFDRKSVFEFPLTDGMDLEELELELIDFGLEEIEEYEGIVTVRGDFTEFGNLTKGLESLNIEVTKATLQRIPNNPIEFTEEQMVEIEKLIDKLDDDEDVQAVYTNIE